MSISLYPLAGMPAIRAGDDLATTLRDALRQNCLDPVDGDVLIVCQKIVSKAEGRSVALGDVVPGPRAVEAAREADDDKDPRLVELVLRHSERVVRMSRGVLIVETGPGWVCANAGIDASNTGDPDRVLLLPADPDATASSIAGALAATCGADVGVIISDTWGRPWRVGLVDFAIGVAGLNPLRDMRGHTDMDGRELHHTVHADADALAAAAGLLMGKDAGIPAVLVRGYRRAPGSGSGRDLIRDRDTDLFR
jgi:coenzyme F420-0:L-glutamate ligase/coenzyme F420-1:gamma-L-glutamate ligase